MHLSISCPGRVGEYRGFDKLSCEMPGAKSAVKSPLCPQALVGDLTTYSDEVLFYFIYLFINKALQLKGCILIRA